MIYNTKNRKLLIIEPKSRKDSEVAFMPEQVANRLSEYIEREKLSPDDTIFPICYTSARSLIRHLAKIIL